MKVTAVAIFDGFSRVRFRGETVSGRSRNDSRYRDPERSLRRDTPTGHRNTKWFAEMVATLVPGNGTVHLRGLHYRICSKTGVWPPDDAKLYTNRSCWLLLQDT